VELPLLGGGSGPTVLLCTATAFEARLLARSVGGRLAVGWLAGTLTSAAGVAASYFLDLPTGATVVSAFGLKT